MALNIENIIAEIKEATILELNDLVKAIEEEIGVTAAAPVAVAAAGAAEKAGLEGLAELFVGPSAVAFSNDSVAPAKTIYDFAKTADALEIKGGAVEGKVSTKAEIEALATLPNREGMLSMLLSVLQAPVRNVAYAVKAVAENKEDAA